MTRLIALAAMLTSLATGTAAEAHPRFEASIPERGGTVAVAPKQIRVTFSEAVLAEGSTFAVRDAEGRAMGVGRLSRAAHGKTLILPVTANLPAGAYTVEWRVAAAGHTSVPGRFRFNISR